MNKILSFIIVLAVIGGGIFLYVTRPVAVPTENIQDQVEPVATDNTTAAATQLAGTTDEDTTFAIMSNSAGAPLPECNQPTARNAPTWAE
jgi:hypothetical protein